MKRFQWKIGQAKHQVSSLEFWDGNEAFFFICVGSLLLVNVF